MNDFIQIQKLIPKPEPMISVTPRAMPPLPPRTSGRALSVIHQGSSRLNSHSVSVPRGRDFKCKNLSVINTDSSKHLPRKRSLSFKQVKRQLPPYVTASSWSVYDGNKGIKLQGKKDLNSREIASMTKIMTCLVVRKLHIQKKIKWDDKVHITDESAGTIGTTAEIQVGDQIAIWDLLFGLMLPSGNDAAMALAKHCGDVMHKNGGIDAFIDQMNTYATRFGMVDTTYNNPHGLSDIKNKSSARDVCRLAYYFLKDQVLEQIVSTKTYTGTIENPQSGTRKMTWINTNKLLDQGYIGVKTGITPNAGPCLCAASRRKGQLIIVCLINSRSMEHRWNEIAKLSDWAFARYS